MEELEKIIGAFTQSFNGRNSVDYKKKDGGSYGFNPQYKIQKESLNINPLSARSCKCYPCRC
jgi:hypothetical protein